MVSKQALTALFLLPIVTAITCCGASSTGDEAIYAERIDSVELVRTGELSFVMDEETSPNLQTTFYDEASGYYYIHNTITGYIERFHTDSTVKSPVRTKISGIPWGINVVSSDSIYLLDLYKSTAELIRLGRSIGYYARRRGAAVSDSARAGVYKPHSWRALSDSNRRRDRTHNRPVYSVSGNIR